MHGKEIKMTSVSVEEELSLNFNKVESLISNWLDKLSKAQQGHYSETEYLNSIHQWLGIALIVLTTGVTAFIFFESEQNKDLVKLMIAIASAMAAALSGIVTFGRFGERANEHRITAGRYGKLRRQLEFLQATRQNLQDKQDVRDKLKTLRIEWEYVAANAPLTPKEKKPCLIRQFLI